MTPTPEMIAMAERIAARMCSCECGDAGSAALTAIMEVSEKVADHVYAKGYTLTTAELSDAIRNGEHLNGN